MKAARERPGPPACTAWSAKSPSSVRAGAPRRPKDSTDIGTRDRAEDTCRCARRLEASRAAAANPGVRAAPTAKDAAAGWMTETGQIYVGLGFLVRLRFALRGLAMWRVRAIAPSFIFGWRAFSSVSLCKSIKHHFTRFGLTLSRRQPSSPFPPSSACPPGGMPKKKKKKT
jgi:hypothetical protein